MSWQLLEEEVAGAMRPLLQEQQQQPHNQQLLQDLLQLLVNFHGDAVMLLNWSHVNFSAVVKTLKKFDKRTGSCLRTPLMQQALCQVRWMVCHTWHACHACHMSTALRPYARVAACCACTTQKCLSC